MNESTSANTHTRRSLFRYQAVGILVGATVGFPAWGQPGCEAVPESSRAQCEKVMDCITIEDADVRRACIAAVQRQVEDDPPETRQAIQRERLQQPTQPPTVEEPAAPQQIVQPPTLEEKTVPPQAVQAPTLEEQTLVTRRTTSDPAGDAPQPRDDPLREPPDSFTGQVTRIHQSVLERQVIAIDNRYLFASDQASQARLKVGQAVEARKARSKITSGRTWRLVGPARRPIDAFRIRCERDDIGSDDRRRCERMLDR